MLPNTKKQGCEATAQGCEGKIFHSLNHLSRVQMGFFLIALL
jgi:hypothetical protein